MTLSESQGPTVLTDNSGDAKVHSKAAQPVMCKEGMLVRMKIQCVSKDIECLAISHGPPLHPPLPTPLSSRRHISRANLCRLLST